MTRYERHPAPEKMLRQITTEAVNLLALGTPDKPGDASLPEAGATLIVKAWGLPQDLLDNSLALIQRQKRLVGDGSGKAALPDDELLEPYDGGMIAELVWGLFETATRLEDPEDRQTMYHLALLLATSWTSTSGSRAAGRRMEKTELYVGALSMGAAPLLRMRR